MKNLLIEYRLRKLENKYNEAKQVGDIYHVAELSVAGKIADSDQLGLKGHSFFTREKNFNIVAHHYNRVFISVRFTVDGDKLSENYKVDPVNNHWDDGDIQWEVVVNRSIKNFHKFVKAVDIMADTNAFRTKGKRGTWGKAKSDFNLAINDKYMNADRAKQLYDSLSSLQEWCKQNNIPLDVDDERITVRDLLKSLKNYSEDDKITDDQFDEKKFLYTAQNNYGKDYIVKKGVYKSTPAIILTDKKDKNHKFMYVLFDDNIAFYEIIDNQVSRSKKFSTWMKDSIDMMLWEIDKRIW